MAEAQWYSSRDYEFKFFQMLDLFFLSNRSLKCPSNRSFLAVQHFWLFLNGCQDLNPWPSGSRFHFRQNTSLFISRNFLGGGKNNFLTNSIKFASEKNFEFEKCLFFKKNTFRYSDHAHLYLQSLFHCKNKWEERKAFFLFFFFSLWPDYLD